MKRQRGRHVAPKPCRHRRFTRTPTAGLERFACKVCGAVSIRYLYNGVIQDDIVISEPDPGSAA